MTAPITVTEDEIQAFVDGRLDEAARDRVRSHLAQSPEDAQRVEDYRRQRAALRAILRPIADEPVPARLAVVAWNARRARGSVLAFQPHAAVRRVLSGRVPVVRIPVAQVAAIALVCLGVGGALGWTFAPAAGPPRDGIRPLVQEAADAYRTYAADTVHPVEMTAGNMPALTAWVSSRLGKPVDAPRSADGFSLIGGRVVPTSRGPAAMFMYTGTQTQAPPAILLVCPLSLHRDAPMVEATSAKLTSVTWSEHGMGYSLIGDMPASRLRSMAEDMRRSFGSDT